MRLDGTESPTFPPPLTYPGCRRHSMPRVRGVQCMVRHSLVPAAVEHQVGRTPHYGEGAASGGSSLRGLGPVMVRLPCHRLCDNQAVVACLRSRTCLDHHIMHMLRTLAFIEASSSFALCPQYISNTDNHLAEDLSRNCLSSFLSKVPDANRRETSLPGPLVELLLDPTLDWTSPQWLQRFSATFKTGWHHPRAEPTTRR